MKKEKAKFTPQMSAVIIALCVLIIGEAVWLMGKLEKTARKTGSETPAALQPTKAEKAAAKAKIVLSGPRQAKEGEEFTVKVFLQVEKSFAADGLDLILSYDPQALKVIDQNAKQKGIQIAVADKVPFQIKARNFVEPEKKRILLTLLDLKSKAGVSLRQGEKVALATISFEAQKAGETKVAVQLGDKATQIVEAGTGVLIPLAKEDFSVLVL